MNPKLKPTKCEKCGGLSYWAARPDGDPLLFDAAITTVYQLSERGDQWVVTGDMEGRRLHSEVCT